LAGCTLVSRINKALDYVDEIRQEVDDLNEEVRWINGAQIPPDVVVKEMTGKGMPIYMAISTKRNPTQADKQAHRQKFKKPMEKGTQFIDYIPAPFDVKQAREVLPTLKENQNLHCFVESHEVVEPMIEERRTKIGIIESTRLKKALESLRKWQYLAKPVVDCPVCMLFWYGSAAFGLLVATGLASWAEWLPTILTAYGLMLGPAFVRSFSEPE
jgi:hypothetical protein